ncbi:MAG: glycosyltransferase [Candidatus Bathyarchaeia archaeon]
MVCPESIKPPYNDNSPARIHGKRIALESFACGRCVILGSEMCKKHGFRIVEDGVNALVVEPEIISQFSEKLRFVIENRKEVDRIGREARKILESIIGYKEYFRRLVGLFEEVAKR